MEERVGFLCKRGTALFSCVGCSQGECWLLSGSDAMHVLLLAVRVQCGCGEIVTTVAAGGSSFHEDRTRHGGAVALSMRLCDVLLFTDVCQDMTVTTQRDTRTHLPAYSCHSLGADKCDRGRSTTRSDNC